MTVYKFTTIDGSLSELASRLRAAGHEVIGFDEEAVTMRPFESIDDLPFDSWVRDMQAHFRCEYTNANQ